MAATCSGVQACGSCAGQHPPEPAACCEPGPAAARQEADVDERPGTEEDADCVPNTRVPLAWTRVDRVLARRARGKAAELEYLVKWQARARAARAACLRWPRWRRPAAAASHGRSAPARGGRGAPVHRSRRVLGKGCALRLLSFQGGATDACIAWQLGALAARHAHVRRLRRPLPPSCCPAARLGSAPACRGGAHAGDARAGACA